MSRLHSEEPFTCVACDALTGNSPVFHVGLPFCCAGCVAGGPCTCSYDADFVDPDRTGRVKYMRPGRDSAESSVGSEAKPSRPGGVAEVVA